MVRWALVRGWFLSRTIDWGYDGREVSVLMCLWNRPERIEDVLQLLDAQDHPEGIHLRLWNNRREHQERYLSAIAEFRPKGALRAVSIVRSPHNIGSIARFYWARKLELSSPGRPIIVLDDDQDISTGFVTSALRQYDPTAVTAWWAWRINSDDYWDRVPAQVGDPVDHIGPGGSVMSTSVFRDASFFTAVPDEYRMLDDIWLSHWAPRHGRALRKLEAEIEFVLDETNQYHGQVDLKSQFYDLLRARG